MEKVDLGSRYLVAEKAQAVLRVRIDRADKRNSCTQDMYRGLKRAAIVADRDPEIALMCLTGTGEWFGSGGDMSGQAEDPESLASELDPTDHFPFRHLERCRKPIFAAVNGLCHAGGLNLVLYSDFSIASDRATFRAPELLRGAPDPWIAARLASYVGVGTARYLLFTAAKIDAAEALRIGLVGRVVPDADFDVAVEETIEQVRRMAPGALSMVKDHIAHHLPAPDSNMFQRAIQSPEMAEGLAAFIEKRPPVWPRQ